MPKQQPVLDIDAARPVAQADDAAAPPTSLRLMPGDFALIDARQPERTEWFADLCCGIGGDLLAWLLSTSRIGGTVAAVGLAADMKLDTSVAPFILRGVALLGADSANCPMALRQTIWNRLAVEWRPDQVHDQVRTIDFDELPTHFDAYLNGLVRGRTVVRIGADTHP